MTIADAITLAHGKGVDVLDAELLLTEVLAVTQAFILGHPETQLDDNQEQTFSALIERRSNNEPLAYLLGRKEFFGLNLRVDKNVLVPRPETEDAITWVIEKAKETTPHKILDIGTGSGAIACALASRLPKSEITALDTKEKVLDLARQNARENGFNSIHFIKSDLLEKLEENDRYQVVVANLPYLDPEWKADPSTQHEPKEALYAGKDGLELYARLLKELPLHLQENAYGIFEADPRNVHKLLEMTKKSLPGFFVQPKEDLAQRERFITFEKVIN